MLDYKYYGLRHDVWGMGILMFFLLGGEFPFEGRTEEQIMKQIQTKEPDWKLLEQRHVDKLLIESIKGMLLKDPGLRLTIKQVMASTPFKTMISKIQEGVVFIYLSPFYVSLYFSLPSILIVNLLHKLKFC